MREAGFGHDETDEGRAVVQRWTTENLNVTIDFLIPPVEDEQRGGAIKHLESDFGAIVAPGLPLAFDEREFVDLDGATLAGDRATRSVPVCGPAAYVVLKALAFRRRGTRKDAYDSDYVLADWPPGVRDVAERMARHATTDADTVAEALAYLRDDYDTIRQHLAVKRGLREARGVRPDRPRTQSSSTTGTRFYGGSPISIRRRLPRRSRDIVAAPRRLTPAGGGTPRRRRR